MKSSFRASSESVSVSVLKIPVIEKADTSGGKQLWLRVGYRHHSPTLFSLAHQANCRQAPWYGMTMQKYRVQRISRKRKELMPSFSTNRTGKTCNRRYVYKRKRV